MHIIGLTGGIGSGKSTVSEQLIKLGYKVIDADKIAREIVLPGGETILALKSAFGMEIINEDGSLNRKKMGQIAFGDPEKKALLDSLMHSKIREIIREKILMYEHEEFTHLEADKDVPLRHSILFIDAPLLLESGLDQHVNEIWVVDCDDQTRIDRIKRRDGLTEDEIRARMTNQMNSQDKISRADQVLDNSGTVKDLYKQIDKLLRKR